MAASEHKEWLLHRSLLFLRKAFSIKIAPWRPWDRACWREKLGRNTYPQLPFQGNNFSTAFLCCWKYLNTVLPSVCCKQHPFTREKCSPLTWLSLRLHCERTFSLCVSSSGLNLPSCQCHCSISPLIPVELLSTGCKGGQSGEAVRFSKQPTLSFRETTGSRSLSITVVKPAQAQLEMHILCCAGFKSCEKGWKTSYTQRRYLGETTASLTKTFLTNVNWYSIYLLTKTG